MAVISQAYLWISVCWQCAASSPSASVLMGRGTDGLLYIMCDLAWGTVGIGSSEKALKSTKNGGREDENSEILSS